MSHLTVTPGAIATITLNRPDVRNAMSDETLRDLTEAFRAVAARVVIVTGAGRDFCAGADIEWMRRAGKLTKEEGVKDAKLLATMLKAVDECPAVVIVAGHGNVFGGGLGLLAACDIAVLAEDAKLCFSEVRLGIMPAVISSWVIPKIGVTNARRYFLTAELFGAKEAVAMGLAHESSADPLKRAQELAALILKNSPQAVSTAKHLIPKLAVLPMEERVDLTIETLVRLRSSPEGQEGLSAFLEKRKPNWSK
jgi:methylglutaconyl-CoA hydratase